jgi:predicted enzyme related to lactoylglutathione lyase
MIMTLTNPQPSDWPNWPVLRPLLLVDQTSTRKWRVHGPAGDAGALWASRRHGRYGGSYALAVVEILTSRVLLRPTDLGRSVRFYEEVIGLAIYREWGAGPARGVVFFLGGGLLEISGTNPEPPSPAIALVLQVRNIGATHHRLIEQGVVVDAEPEQKPWGLIEMTVRDPDGLALIIVEVPPEHPRRRG